MGLISWFNLLVLFCCCYCCKGLSLWSSSIVLCKDMWHFSEHPLVLFVVVLCTYIWYIFFVVSKYLTKQFCLTIFMWILGIFFEESGEGLLSMAWINFMVLSGNEVWMIFLELYCGSKKHKTVKICRKNMFNTKINVNIVTKFKTHKIDSWWVLYYFYY